MKTANAPKHSERSAGVLLHITSLPGSLGIGDFGPEARVWVDALCRAKQSWWQLLPLGPTGSGNSPYQSFSAFAGNPDLISPEDLVRDGLLTRRDLAGIRGRYPAESVDYDRVRTVKASLLEAAWERFQGNPGRRMRNSFEEFRRRESDWLDGFALFMSLRDARGNACWTEWPKELVVRQPEALRSARKNLAERMAQHQFGQFLFYRQLEALRRYAHERGVHLIGDLPIYVSGDSADVWANPHLFQLDRQRRPKAVAGVPPDLFSRTGQRWGNPLYDWGAMREERYAWWVARVRAMLKQVDLIRIDHFRGFEAYWSIPAAQRTAQRGRWVKAPGAELFEVLRQKLGGLRFIAEDLGVITPEVTALRERFQLPGMRVLQFAFGDGPGNEALPHHHEPNAVAYTGTHDNDTTLGWYKSLPDKVRRQVIEYAPEAAQDPVWALIRIAWASVADCAIVPAQDLLELGSEARMNVPGRADGNWGWRLRTGAMSRRILDRLGELTEVYGRAAPARGRSTGRGMPRR